MPHISSHKHLFPPMCNSFVWPKPTNVNSFMCKFGRVCDCVARWLSWTGLGLATNLTQHCIFFTFPCRFDSFSDHKFGILVLVFYLHIHKHILNSIIYLGIVYVVSQLNNTTDISLSWLHHQVRLNKTFSPFPTCIRGSNTIKSETERH